MRGLFLAVTTLALAVAAPWILERPIFLDPDHPSPLLRRPGDRRASRSSRSAPTTSSASRSSCSASIVVARIRRSGLGRSLLAVRDNELAAAAMGLSPARTKLFAFAVSGALAGLAGGALVGLLVQFETDRFDATAVARSSWRSRSSAGCRRSPGPILGALFVVGLPAFFPDSPEVALLTSGIGVLVLLLYFPGGLVQILYNARDVVFGGAGRSGCPRFPTWLRPRRWRDRRGPWSPWGRPPALAAQPAVARRRRPRPASSRSVSVRFGAGRSCTPSTSTWAAARSSASSGPTAPASRR